MKNMARADSECDRITHMPLKSLNGISTGITMKLSLYLELTLTKIVVGSILDFYEVLALVNFGQRKMSANTFRRNTHGKKFHIKPYRQ